MSHSQDPLTPEGDVNLIATDYQIGQDNIVVSMGPFGLDIHNRVFVISGLAIIAFVALTLLFQSQAEPLFSAIRGWLTANLDWFFISAGNVLVIVFFVTSSDSGSLVIDAISAGGKVNAPVPQRVFWCLFEGLVAIALILGGGLVALQAMAVSTGLPFAVVLLAATVAVVQGLWSEPRSKRQRAAPDAG